MATAYYDWKSDSIKLDLRPNRCGANAKSTKQPCRKRALKNGRCKLHGGLFTGPKTAEGKAQGAGEFEAVSRR